jgi:branched-chain amino acid transport system ATP-binding protein
VAVVNTLLTVTHLAKRFGGVAAIQDAHFSVGAGEIYSVIGPNGAGKSTLFNLISAIFRPDSGTIQFGPHRIDRMRSHQLASIGIGRTFQNLALFKHASVVENILVGMHSHLTSGPFRASFFLGHTRSEEIEARRRVEEIIDFMEISELRDKPVGSLSYGQQKRVELGRALATRPRLLLLDEMVSGMNEEETEDIARFILDIRDQLNITVMMIEHHMGIVMDISDRICVLNFGTTIAEGTPEQIRANEAVRQAYLGQAEPERQEQAEAAA